jgi:hypothetical protein
MVARAAIPDDRRMSLNINPKQTSAFYLQSVLSFGVSLGAVLTGVAWLPVEVWVRAFLALGLLYVVTSSFTLAKVVRDAQEQHSVLSRVDEARLERLLSEHDPLRV